MEEEELLLPVLVVGVVPAPPGLACSPAQVNLPLMTLLAPERDLKVLHALEMSPEDCRLKAPRISAMAGRETLYCGQHSCSGGEMS